MTWSLVSARQLPPRSPLQSSPGTFASGSTPRQRATARRGRSSSVNSSEVGLASCRRPTGTGRLRPFGRPRSRPPRSFTLSARPPALATTAVLAAPRS
eukprot:11140368-Alexandrium_andersonii.AAC.1